MARIKILHCLYCDRTHIHGFGLCDLHYHRWLDRRPMEPKPKSIEDYSEIINLYASGLSTRAVGQRIGLDGSYVAKILRFLGLARTRSESLLLVSREVSLTPRACRWRARNIWEKANGPIPENHVIHHIDGDFTNNSLTNLACITYKAHAFIHLAGPEYHIPHHLHACQIAFRNRKGLKNGSK